MKSKRTIILGASPNPSRYSNIATKRLMNNQVPIFPIGIRKGEIQGVPIITDKTIIPDIDTITLYIGAKNQPQWYDYILATHPNRIIFNPGTENSELEKMAQQSGIETEIACTLVLLSIDDY